MIKVSVLYPNEPGKKFDFDYFVNTHVPMVHRLLGPMGMVKAEFEKGVSGPDPSAPPDFIAVGYLYFNTVDAVHEGFKTHGREIMGDIKNYSDIEPKVLIGELVA